MKKLGIVLLVLFFAILPFAADRTPQDHLMFTEVAVDNATTEFIEIYNPSDYELDLSNVYITDATTATNKYYFIVTGVNYGGGSSADFHAKFPAGAKIGAKSYLVIAMDGTAFAALYGFDADYELYDTGNAAPKMDEAMPGSINFQGGLSDKGEVVIMYYWDGVSDLVKDLDYLVWGDKAEAIDKTGILIDSIYDADAVLSAYADDTSINSQIAQVEIGDGDLGFFTCNRSDYSESTETTTGGNGIFGDDVTSADLLEEYKIGTASPGAAYADGDYYKYHYLGYAEDDGNIEIEDVDFSLYATGTTLDDILFLGAVPIDTLTSTSNGYSGRRVNLDFEGLTEGASYVINAFGNGYSSNYLGKTVYSGNHDYLYVYDELTDTTKGIQVCEASGSTLVDFDWANYLDTASGDTAVSYELRVYDGTTVNTYTTANTTYSTVLNEGDTVKYVIYPINGSGYYISRSAVGELKVMNFIDKVVLVDDRNIKVYFTVPIDDLGTIDVDGIAPFGTNFTQGNDYAEFEFTNPFIFGNTYTLNVTNFTATGDADTYTQSMNFVAESDFGIASGSVERADCLIVSYTTTPDTVTAGNTANYTISPAMTISSVNIIMGTNVQLVLASDINYNDTYTISVSTTVKSAKDLPINSNDSVVVSKAGTQIQLTSAEVMTADMVECTFSGNVDPAAVGSQFSTNPALTVAGIVVGGNLVDVYFTTNIAKGTNYTITANVEDPDGFDIDGAHNSTVFVLNVTYPKVTKAEMINNQTVKVYFNKDMSLDPDAWGYVKWGGNYIVYLSDWSNYHFINMVEYNIEEKSATLHLDSVMTMNRTDYTVECDDGLGTYVEDSQGYDLSQSGVYWADFSTKIDDLDQVYSYPSPATTGSITFTNLVGSGTISIYTLNGVKIDDIDFAGDVEKTVELKTPSGKDYVNGIYLYRVDSDKGTITGSFAVLK
ncbi:lamin tail domain-containing protein [bacterium]|nr:lamin tail domain-containing protein [bacterium]